MGSVFLFRSVRCWSKDWHFMMCVFIIASCHCVALDVEGRCYTWGRNEVVLLLFVCLFPLSLNRLLWDYWFGVVCFQKGQLGHGDMIQRDRPTVVSGLSKWVSVSFLREGLILTLCWGDCVSCWRYKIVKAGAGRNHTVVVSEEGRSFAFGWNKHGQLGLGTAKNGIC